MAITVDDLPPKYQAQVLKKVMEQQGKKGRTATTVMPEQEKGRKYHNTPTERVTATGAVLRFDSAKEARRYDYLMGRLQIGQIKDLRLQVDFTLQEAYTDEKGKRVRAERYRADFTYYERDQDAEEQGARVGFDCTGWRYVVEDVKSEGTRTAIYQSKKKRVKAIYGIDITEV